MRTKEEIETKIALIRVRAFDPVEGRYAHKTIEVEVRIETTAKEVLEGFMGLIRVRRL